MNDVETSDGADETRLGTRHRQGGDDALAHDDKRWHLKKEIQVPHIISTVLIVVSALTYVNKLETRIALIEQAMTTQGDRDHRQDERVNELVNVMTARLDRMDGKLDRLMERRP